MRRYSFPLAAAILLTAGGAHAQTVFSGIGGPNNAGPATPGTALQARNDFLAAIGGVNNGGTPGTQPSGFRQIVWDGVAINPATGADTTINANTTAIVTTKFQANGALYNELTAVSNDGFGSVNPGAGPTQNPTFSGTRTFASFSDNGVADFVIDQAFIVPGNAAVPAATRGFGAIFTDVELANTSSIEFFNGATSLGTFFVPVGGDGQFSFLGVLFPTATVTNVRLTLGNANLFNFQGGVVTPGAAENPLAAVSPTDTVATDDFVYAEPVAAAAPEPATLGLLAVGMVTGVVARRRRAR
jgi:hypothetical protein